MKKFLSIAIAGIMSVGLTSAQEKTLPSVSLSSIDGKSVNLKDAVHGHKVTVVSFWAMWCTNCLTQYNSLATKMNEINVPFYAVSIDAKDQEAKVTPFVQSKGWRFSFLLDPEKQVFRALGATFPPHLFIVNAQGKVLWEQRIFNENSEAEFLAKLKELNK
ncbi:MAG: TlpA disulfide reductase family protein [Bacteroidetes bacterium]|nr:TlpA disulfide reductase family protein [Bacteroidota bacterium]